LYAKSGYVRTALIDGCNNVATTTVADIWMLGGSWNNTADNITQLDIVSSQANGLGIGTVIELWAFRRKV
jgi:hypothetical protein